MLPDARRIGSIICHRPTVFYKVRKLTNIAQVLAYVTRMRHLRKTFNEIMQETAKEATSTLFSKARMASEVAKIAFTNKGRDTAYDMKHKLLDTAVELSPNEFRRYKDEHTGRWVIVYRKKEAIHGRKLNES